MLHELSLLAALRHAQLDLVGALDAQGLLQQRRLFDLLRKEDAARARLVVIELCKERAKHFTCSQGAIRLRKIGAIAPILSGAEEENFDAGEAARLVDCKHVGVLDTARIDALVRLYSGERGKAVAVDARPLELERGRRVLHLVGQL